MSVTAVGPSDPAESARLMRLATMASVAVALTLVLAKAAAWAASDAVTLLASLVDSALDAVASLANLLAVRHALTPADREHRFGHGKAEALSGLAQAVFITGSAVFLIVEAAQRLQQPVAPTGWGAGVAVMVLSMALTAGLLEFAFGWRAVARAFADLAGVFRSRRPASADPLAGVEVPSTWFATGMLVLTPLVGRLAPRIGGLDDKTDRPRVHTGAIPRIGGSAQTRPIDRSSGDRGDGCGRALACGRPVRRDRIARPSRALRAAVRSSNTASRCASRRRRLRARSGTGRSRPLPTESRCSRSSG